MEKSPRMSVLMVPISEIVVEVMQAAFLPSGKFDQSCLEIVATAPHNAQEHR